MQEKGKEFSPSRSVESHSLGDEPSMQEKGEDYSPSRSVASQEQVEEVALSNTTPNAFCEANTSHHADLASPSSNSNGTMASI
jgi:hypothetical protein